MALFPYEELGVKKTASAAEIKKAYRRRIREVHPDRHPDDPHANAKTQQVQAAYDLLSDPVRRKLYDEEGIVATRNYDELAKEKLKRVLVSVLGYASDGIVGKLNFNIDAELTELKKSYKVGKDYLKQLNDARKKYKFNGTDDFVGAAIDERIAETQKGLSYHEEEMRVVQRAKELLREFEDVGGKARGEDPWTMRSMEPSDIVMVFKNFEY